MGFLKRQLFWPSGFVRPRGGSHEASGALKRTPPETRRAGSRSHDETLGFERSRTHQAHRRGGEMRCLWLALAAATAAAFELAGFGLDVGTGLLTLTFDEAVQSKTLNASALVLQSNLTSARTPMESFRLTGHLEDVFPHSNASETAHAPERTPRRARRSFPTGAPASTLDRRKTSSTTGFVSLRRLASRTFETREDVLAGRRGLGRRRGAPRKLPGAQVRRAPRGRPSGGALPRDARDGAGRDVSNRGRQRGAKRGRRLVGAGRDARVPRGSPEDPAARRRSAETRRRAGTRGASRRTPRTRRPRRS